MCGIVGYTGNKDATEILINGLSRLEYRGYDSAGVTITAENQDFQTVKASGRLSQLRQKLQEKGTSGHCGIGHTRWATHGSPSEKNAHPHGNENIMLVHNGIIENFMELKKELIAKGVLFSTDTDTEVIVHLLQSYHKGDPIAAIYQTIQKLQGSYALVILFRSHPNTLYAIRKDSPLIVGKGVHENFAASDIPAILPYTKKYYLLGADELAIIQQEKITFLNREQKIINKKCRLADFQMPTIDRGCYPHFMLKEIYEQPEVFLKTAMAHIYHDTPVFLKNTIPEKFLQQLRKIHIVACGTAMHAGMIGKCIIETFAKIPVEVDIASEFRYRHPILCKQELIVLISQSGETADTLAALRLAKAQKIPTLAIVNAAESSIAREADYLCYTLAGPEIAVASTKAYTVQLAVLYLFSLHLAKLKRLIPLPVIKSYCKEFLDLPKKMEEVLSHADNIKKCASLLKEASHIFFIGRGIDYALSLEGSLKLKEISYIHSEAYAAGELKHGTISLITEDIPVIAIATQKELLKKTISNIKEVKTRGAKIIFITSSQENFDEIADFCIKIPDTDEHFAPILAAVVLQLLAYDTALFKGCDIDKPRNLAKSVTVE